MQVTYVQTRRLLLAETRHVHSVHEFVHGDSITNGSKKRQIVLTYGIPACNSSH